MFEDPAFLVTGFSSKEERQKPIEISSGFSSIKPLDLPDQVSYRLFRMSGINSYESRHIEVLPGKYEILVYCNSGSAWMTFPKTVVAEANKKYHVICFKPIGEKDLANVVIVEKSLPDEISINEYISKVKR